MAYGKLADEGAAEEREGIGELVLHSDVGALAAARPAVGDADDELMRTACDLLAHLEGGEGWGGERSRWR